MASSSARSRTIPAVVRELCLSYPEVEEFTSHGSPNYRAKKGTVFAVFALNHHGDGHVALLLKTPAMEQSRLIASSPRHLFKPAYVGPSGWIGVELNRGFSWKRVIELVHMAYVNSSPAKLVAKASKPVVVAPPSRKMKPAEIDRLMAPRAVKLLVMLRRMCLSLPETGESPSFGSPNWRVGKSSFAMVYDYRGLTVAFWVGIERQGPLVMDPRFSIPAYLGHNGWIALDASKGVNERELREFLLDSYRHFATRRALAKLTENEKVA
jgi:predicted DNA-binding protein (MmcQ/YjbR family)